MKTRIKNPVSGSLTVTGSIFVTDTLVGASFSGSGSAIIGVVTSSYSVSSSYALYVPSSAGISEVLTIAYSVVL